MSTGRLQTINYYVSSGSVPKRPHMFYPRCMTYVKRFWHKGRTVVHSTTEYQSEAAWHRKILEVFSNSLRFLWNHLLMLYIMIKVVCPRTNQQSPMEVHIFILTKENTVQNSNYSVFMFIWFIHASQTMNLKFYCKYLKEDMRWNIQSRHLKNGSRMIKIWFG